MAKAWVCQTEYLCCQQTRITTQGPLLTGDGLGLRAVTTSVTGACDKWGQQGRGWALPCGAMHSSPSQDPLGLQAVTLTALRLLLARGCSERAATLPWSSTGVSGHGQEEHGYDNRSEGQRAGMGTQTCDPST